MAKYYYDRYNVSSSTTYTWSKYNVDENTTYSLGSWSHRPGSPELYGVDRGLSGATGYSLAGGKVSTTGSWSGPAGNAPTLYWGQSDTILVRYTTSSAPNNPGYLYLSTQAASLLSSTSYSRGSYISQTSGRSYSYKTNNARNSDGYWWVRGSASTSYSRGSFIDTIIAEDGTYPDNGRVGTTYWYIKRNKAFPDFKVKADGQLRTAEEGWVKINGVLRPIEQMWVKDNGTLKEV